MGRPHTAGPTGGTQLHRTVHARATVVRNGQLLSIPFRSSSRAAKPDPKHQALAYGALSTVLNPPNKERNRSASAACHNALPIMSAGTVHKAPVPYDPNASRNRLRVFPRRLPHPHGTTMRLSSGVAAVSHSTHPYMTSSRFAQEESAKPIHSHVGFTNPGIMAEFTRRAHKDWIEC